MQREVEGLVEALRRIDAPVLGALRPGLSPDQVREEASLAFPPWWLDYIDDDVLAWCSWQNGYDPDLDPDGTLAGTSELAPGGPRLTSVRQSLSSAYFDMDGNVFHELGVAFPLGLGVSGDVFLRKLTPESEWTLWLYYGDSGYEPFATASGHVGPVVFREWLAALTVAIDNRYLVKSDKHGSFMPNPAIDFDPVEDYDEYYYPWTPLGPAK